MKIEVKKKISEKSKRTVNAKVVFFKGERGGEEEEEDYNKNKKKNHYHEPNLFGAATSSQPILQREQRALIDRVLVESRSSHDQ